LHPIDERDIECADESVQKVRSWTSSAPTSQCRGEGARVSAEVRERDIECADESVQKVRSWTSSAPTSQCRGEGARPVYLFSARIMTANGGFILRLLRENSAINFSVP
jgi:hypothetical protein